MTTKMLSVFGFCIDLINDASMNSNMIVLTWGFGD